MKFEISRNLSSRNFVTVATWIILFYLCDDDMIPFIYFHSCHFHWIYYELAMACSPVGSINSMDKAIGQSQRTGFDSRSSLVRFFFNFLLSHFQLRSRILLWWQGPNWFSLERAGTRKSPRSDIYSMLKALTRLFLRSLSRCMTTPKTAV